LKVEVPALIGALLGAISVVLPWWTEHVVLGEIPGTWMIYLYQTTYSDIYASVNILEGEWYGFVAMGLVLAGIALEVVGSFPRFRRILYAGLVLMLTAVLLFLSGLIFYGYSPLTSVTGGESPYSTYLTYGYWLAVASFVIPLFGRLAERREPPAEDSQVSPV
jgi:hypothetical protein